MKPIDPVAIEALLRAGEKFVLLSDANAAVAAEREACARAAEAGHMPWPYYQGMEFSRGCLWAGANIRARSNVKVSGLPQPDGD